MKKVMLMGGFGNRLNNILNYIEEDVVYIWTEIGCNCKWEVQEDRKNGKQTLGRTLYISTRGRLEN